MNSSYLWLLCLIGSALLNQGRCRPNIEGEDYVQDGEGADDYDDDAEETEDTGPPPVIKSMPVTLEVNAGETVVFSCDVDGNQDQISRIWRKDSEGLFLGNVRQTTDPRISRSDSGTLEIHSVQAEDSGTYTCMISVVTDKKQEVAHTLRVRSPAKITSITPSEEFVTIKQTTSQTFVCMATGFPTPSIRWFRNGHVLEDQDPSIHGARYTIENASTEDAGIYKCTATNGQQKPDERTIEVQVNFPPEIKIARAVVPTGEGYESELKCTATGLKKPELRWYKNNEARPIEPTQRIKLEKNGNEHILKIIKTQKSDFADYTCEAKNTEGTTSAVIRLTGKPSRPVAESVEVEAETKNPVLLYKIESFAPIEEYELLYKREEKDEWVAVKPVVTPSQEGKIFTVKHILTDLTPGVYVAQIKAKNSYGWSDFSSQQTFPKEHEGDLTETGLLAITGAASELRISVALIASLLVAHFYC